MANIITKTQTSAGGVAYRERGGKIEIALISVGAAGRWQLPKGAIDKGEQPEVAALREVREEAGIQAELVGPLETIEYWYASRERDQMVRFHKFVHFYLMRYLSGDTADHDHEVNEARWVEIDRTLEMLAFESERKVVEKAKEILAGG
jgi:8-oxo-dGTP pyrophosphatase MutT (NUDIX family)